MLRSICSAALRTSFSVLRHNVNNAAALVAPKYNQFSRFSTAFQVKTLAVPRLNVPNPAPSLLQNVLPMAAQPVRTVTKFSMRKGKRKAVKAVLFRFKRLHWGAWIRTKAGRFKHLWRKSAARKRRLRQHVFCNATQSKLLDKMVTNFWRKPKHYIDDPYEPYHTREDFLWTRKRPLDR